MAKFAHDRGDARRLQLPDPDDALRHAGGDRRRGRVPVLRREPLRPRPHPERGRRLSGGRPHVPRRRRPPRRPDFNQRRNRRRKPCPRASRRRRFAALAGGTAVAAALPLRYAHAAEHTFKIGTNVPATHPAQRPPHQGGRAGQGRDRRPIRVPALPQQPARRRLGHAVPAPLRGAGMLPELRRERAVHDHPLGGDLGRRLRLQGLSGPVERHGRQARREPARADHQGRLRGARPDLGQRLPHDHEQRQAHQPSGRPEGHEDPRAGERAVAVAVQVARRGADRAELRRGLLRPADQGGGRPGEPAGDHLGGQALRGPEVLLGDEPHVGRLVVPDQPPGLEPGARGPPGEDGADRQRRLHGRSARTSRSRTSNLRKDLAAAGLVFNDVDPAPFRDALSKSGFYKEWRSKFGDEAWGLLEEASASWPDGPFPREAAGMD